MGVDEARDDSATAGVDVHVRGGRLRGRTDPGDAAALDDDGGVVDEPEEAALLAHGSGRW